MTGTSNPSNPSDGAIRTAITDTLGDGHSGDGPDHEIVVEPGGKFGRYVAIERLGSGAMGVVYSAYDPKLDRKIAVKLLHPHPVADGTTDGTATRLIREARALAKLSHPNVVTIYDADTLPEGVFIAMEYVDGVSLAAWTRARTHSWREVVDIFGHAGRGLAAAHAVGLVHRDFKPENVLVGDDGRVRVVDFGIARAPGGAVLRPLIPGEEVTDADASASGSRTGASVGTPAYMAPEQHLGRDVDARSDQFSFCASLYEALYGKLPFAGSSLAALAVNVTQGNVREPPARSNVPSWLRRVVLRGLAPDPALRFPSMASLLHELGTDRASRRRRVVLAGVGATTIGLLGWAAVAGDRMVDPCADGERHLEGVWDDDVRADIEHAFTGTGVPFAARSWKSLAAGIDTYTAAWVDKRREACEATLRGEQSSDLLDRRMACLQGRLLRVGALTRVLADADADVVTKAIEGLDALPPLEPCSDVQALLGAESPPVGERKRTVEDAEAVLAEAEALRSAGELDDARRAVGDALGRARAAEAGGLEARALRVEAELALEQGRYAPSERGLFEALAVAERVGADRERAAILLDLGFVLAEARQRYDEAERWLQQADALLQRIHADADQRAELEHVLGLVRARQGRHSDAVEHFERAMSTWRESEGDHAFDLARVRNALAATLDAQGRHEDALSHYQTALALLEQRVGPDHPSVAVALNNLGVTFKLLGRYDEARAAYERALAVRRAALGDQHPKVGATLMNLANVLVAQERYDDAIERFSEALDIQERQLGPVDAAVGKTLYNLGVALQLAGRLPDALDRYRRALDVDLATVGEGHPELAYPRAGLGIVLVELGRGGEAIAPLESALAARQDDEDAPADLGELRFALARALGDVPRARALAEQAAADYRRADDEASATRIDAWVAAR